MMTEQQTHMPAKKREKYQQPDSRICNKCGVVKTADQFGRDRKKNGTVYLTSKCKECMKAYNNEAYYTKRRKRVPLTKRLTDGDKAYIHEMMKEGIKYKIIAQKYNTTVLNIAAWKRKGIV